ncbi:hypothetical protein BDP27DRAFT_1315084, partial [Rhodocollybia butyracea]
MPRFALQLYNVVIKEYDGIPNRLALGEQLESRVKACVCMFLFSTQDLNIIDWDRFGNLRKSYWSVGHHLADVDTILHQRAPCSDVRGWVYSCREYAKPTLSERVSVESRRLRQGTWSMDEIRSSRYPYSQGPMQHYTLSDLIFSMYKGTVAVEN